MKPAHAIMLTAIMLTVTLLAAWRQPSPTAATPPAPPTVTDPTVWLVSTPHGDQPVEHAQPTLWIEGQPYTRYSVDRPGVERWFSVTGSR